MDRTDRTDRTDRKATELPGEPASRAMAAGREAPNPQSGISHDRAREHWQNHEIGYLLAMAVEGMPWDAIAQRLDRTPGGCEAMLRRLVTAQTPCNVEWSASLARAKMIYAAPAKSEIANLKSASSAAALDRVNAQYRALAAISQETREIVSRLENLTLFGLALGVADGDISLSMISRFAGPNQARLVAGLAAEIRDLLDGPAPAEAVAGLAEDREPGDRNETPLVITGQGTSEQRFFANDPGDLIDARPTGSLDVMG